MSDLVNNEDGTCTLTKYFDFDDGTVIISVQGAREKDEQEVEFLISPPLKGTRSYVCKKINAQVRKIEDSVKLLDESLFSDYDIDVLNAVKKVLYDFYYS